MFISLYIFSRKPQYYVSIVLTDSLGVTLMPNVFNIYEKLSIDHVFICNKVKEARYNIRTYCIHFHENGQHSAILKWHFVRVCRPE